MKILHLCTFPGGGAGIACRRLHNALLSAGVESRILFRDDPSGIVPPVRRSFFRVLRKGMDLFRDLAARSGNPSGRSESLLPFADIYRLNAMDADIIHLHWICGDFLSIGMLPKIRKPVVWTLHDNWAYCGSEFCVDILANDQRFREGYCARNKPFSLHGFDLERRIWEYKRKCWHSFHPVFVSPSRWNAEQLTSSALFRGTSCEVIRNPLDRNIFSAGNKQQARARWGLAENLPVVLFGAADMEDPIKGITLLRQAVQILAARRKIQLFCFGSGNIGDFPCPCKSAGVIHSEMDMASICNTAEVMVCPSIIDNSPNTCIEAMACGVPVAGFRTAGLPELIREPGSLAEPFSPESLANAIEFTLDHRTELAAAAEKQIRENNDPEIVAKAYLRIYEKLIR